MMLKVRLQDMIAKDLSTHGSMFVPIILGSDKTTVSVATGQNEYYPIYISIGNVHNTMHRAHKNAVSLLAFLAIPKSMHTFYYMPNWLFSQLTVNMPVMIAGDNSDASYFTHQFKQYLNHCKQACWYPELQDVLMVISDVWYMDQVHISLTTQSNVFWPVQCQTGAPGTNTTAW